MYLVILMGISDDPSSGLSIADERLGHCKSCGSHCCKFGGAVATRNEVTAIIEMGYPDYFVSVSNDVFITRWGADMTCPYLNEGACEIYEVRPLRCRAFPVFQTASGEVFLSQCPIASSLSEEEITSMARKLSECPSEILEGAASYLEPYSKTLERKISRYDRTLIANH
jgi:Fe-S-cluster containining protein